jgi:hypothetical protein
MKIRVTASYAATDGRMPESLDVEIETETPTATTEVTAVIGNVLGQMISAPSARDLAVTDAALKGVLARGGLIKATEAVEVPRCRRTLCGHTMDKHGAINNQGNVKSDGHGACVECSNLDKCRSFVGEGAEQ